MRTSPSLTLALAAATLLGATAIVGCASEIEDDAMTEMQKLMMQNAQNSQLQFKQTLGQ